MEPRIVLACGLIALMMIVAAVAGYRWHVRTSDRKYRMRTGYDRKR